MDTRVGASANSYTNHALAFTYCDSMDSRGEGSRLEGWLSAEVKDSQAWPLELGLRTPTWSSANARTLLSI